MMYRIHKIFHLSTQTVSKSKEFFNSCRNLGYNNIDSLHGQLFNGLNNLNDLTLSHNKLRSIPNDAFGGLPTLKYLYVERCILLYNYCSDCILIAEISLTTKSPTSAKAPLNICQV
jgi:Leucine-rich repeat (LRR) protein